VQTVAAATGRRNWLRLFFLFCSNMKASVLALLLCWLLVLGTGTLYYPKWDKPGSEATISWDVSGYYLYLPALFIYKDMKQCGFYEKILTNYQPTPDFQQAFRHEASGNYVFKYSSGQAFLMAPFFFAGHFVAKKTLWLNDGYSFPYQLAISIGMLFYALLGVWLLRKVLIRFFSDNITAITLLTVVFATNYLNYAAIDGAMTHNTLFTIYAGLLLITIRFYEAPSVQKALLLGSLCGLATLIRPTEIISALIPLLWATGSVAALRQRVHFFFKNTRYLLAAGFMMAAFIAVQPLYWKWASGDWVVYSYQDQGFSWLKPHLYDGFFSSRSGWITYTPVMLLALAGMPFLYRKSKELFWGTAVFSFLFIYICFAWDIWWYGGSLGIRSMVQAYPVLAIGLAALYERMANTVSWKKAVIAFFVLFCTYYNFWLTHQAHKGGLLRAGEMTDAYLWAILLRNKVPDETQLLLDNKDQFVKTPKAASEIYFNDFEQVSPDHVTTDYAVAGKSLFLNQSKQTTPEFSFPFSNRSRSWLRVSADFRSGQKEWNTWRMAQFIVKFYNRGEMVKWNHIRVFRILNENETRRISLDAQLPDQPFDQVAVTFWNADSDKPLLIDNLRVLLLEN